MKSGSFDLDRWITLVGITNRDRGRGGIIRGRGSGEIIWGQGKLHTA